MIAYDATSSGSTGGATSLTFAHTCTGTNRILFVGIRTAESAGADSVTGVTYAGQAMTRITTRSINNPARAYLYYIVAPATGANNVVVSVSPSKAILAYGVSYTGAKQTGQPDSFATAGTTSNDPQVSITVVANGSWLVAVGITNANRTFSADAGTTIRNSAANIAIMDSNAGKSPGANILNTTLSASEAWALCGASFAPEPDPAATEPEHIPSPGPAFSGGGFAF